MMRGMKYIHLKHVACTFRYYNRMGVYAQEPLVGRKQTTHILILVLLFCCGIQSEHGTRSQENREGAAALPIPLPENVLNIVC
jgi:hypothetical protein